MDVGSTTAMACCSHAWMDLGMGVEGEGLEVA